jgi:hypothetical protein
LKKSAFTAGKLPLTVAQSPSTGQISPLTTGKSPLTPGKTSFTFKKSGLNDGNPFRIAFVVSKTLDNIEQQAYSQVSRKFGGRGQHLSYGSK